MNDEDMPPQAPTAQRHRTEVAPETAKKTLARVQLGADPQADKTKAKARAKVTIEAVADRYLKHAKTRLKPRSLEEVERHLTKHWAPLKDLPLHKVD